MGIFALQGSMWRRWTDEQLIAAVPCSESYAGVMKILGLSPRGGNYASIKRHIERLQLNCDHFTGQGWCHGERSKYLTQARPLNEVLVGGRYTNTSNLRIRLIKEGIFESKCYNCHNTEWMGQDIPLELEHIDGDSSNNLRGNLTLLCPNCHAQTATYRRKK